MAAVSLTSGFVAVATFAVCAITVAVDDRATVTTGERIGRLAGYFVWAVVIAFAVPESWGWQRPLAITSTFSLGFITGIISAKPIDRLRMSISRQWEQLDEVAQCLNQEDALSTVKRSGQLSENGRIPLEPNTGYNETPSSARLTPSESEK